MRRSVRDRRRSSSYPVPDVGRVLPYGFAIFCSATLVVLVILAVWLVVRLDWTSVIDFIAPTAKQAREAGWVTVSEGL